MYRSAAAAHVEFSISHLEAWAPGVTTRSEWQEWANGAREIGTTGEPPLQQMPPLLRRHAGRLGRFACSVAYEALGDTRAVPVVFSSRYGEVSRSVDLLSSLAAGEELSPATFGLSVHNAIPGLFSMARKDTANTVSLAAGDDSAEFGFIEACALLDDGAAYVLLVVADVPLPAIYESFADTSAEPFGWAALITKPGDSFVRLSWSESPADPRYSHPGSTAAAAAASAPVRTLPSPGALVTLGVLVGDATSAERVSGQRTWRWSRHG